MDITFCTYGDVAEQIAAMIPSRWDNWDIVQRARTVAIFWAREELPNLKAIIDWRKAEAKAKLEQEAARKAARAEKRREKHQSMSKLVLKAMSFYGDCCYEYAQQLWGEDGPELMTSGAKEFSDDDDDMLMGEAIYAAFGGSISCNTFDQIKAYWKKYYR